MPPQTEPTPFERIGGQPTIDRLVDRFYDEIEHSPSARELRAIHSTDLGEIRRVLKLYLGEWLGGPRAYSGERGHPRLRARHLPFAIGVAERDAWLACMRAALEGTVADEEAREGIYGAMARLADFMRNRADEAPPG
ncbi:MAG: globin [Proteobacteria bacterium]|nr:MAG: globin [Pseudomonadota bacterium]